MEQDTSNEKPAKQHWSNKLEETCSLPALLLQDKNAAWEKLHNRLQQKPRRINPGWYWAAAAGIMVLCSLPFFITDSRQANQKNKSVKNTVIETSAPTIARQEKKDTITAKAMLTQEMTKTTAYKLPSDNKNRKAVNQPPKLVHLSNDEVLQNEIITTTTAATAAENKIIEPMIAVTTPVKQRLRVVHINELGDAIPERNTARVAEEGFIKFNIINQQINTGTTAKAKAISFNISKSSSTN